MPKLFGDVVKAVCHAALVEDSFAGSLVGDTFHSAGDDDVSPATLGQIDWNLEQMADEGIAFVSKLKDLGFCPREEEAKAAPMTAKPFMREFSCLFKDRGVLYRTATTDGQKVKQLVLPKAFQDVAFQGIHDDSR